MNEHIALVNLDKPKVYKNPQYYIFPKISKTNIRKKASSKCKKQTLHPKKKPHSTKSPFSLKNYFSSPIFFFFFYHLLFIPKCWIWEGLEIEKLDLSLLLFCWCEKEIWTQSGKVHIFYPCPTPNLEFNQSSIT